MSNFYGVGFANKEAFGVKKLRKGWAVYNVRTGQLVLTHVPSKLRAQYVAAMHMGMIKDLFHFGDTLINKND